MSWTSMLNNVITYCIILLKIDSQKKEILSFHPRKTYFVCLKQQKGIISLTLLRTYFLLRFTKLINFAISKAREKLDLVWVPDTSDTIAKRVRYERHECDTSEKILILITAQVKTFVLYKEKKKIHSKNYLLEVHRSYAKMRLRNAPQKLNFIMAKAIHQKVIH